MSLFFTRLLNKFLQTLALLAMTFPTLSTASETSRTVKIVSSFPREGSINLAVEPLIKSFRLALDEADYKAGAYNIVYEDLNHANNDIPFVPEKVIENANKAVLDPDVMVFLGPDPSGAVALALPILNTAGLVMLSPTSTYPGFTKPAKQDEPQKYQQGIGLPSFARVIPSDNAQGEMAALFAKQLNVKSVYVLSDGGLYGNQLATVFVNHAEQNGLQIKNLDQNFETLDLSVENFKELAERISRLKPELIFVGINASNRAGELWQELKAAATSNPPMMMSGDNLTVPPFLDEASVAAEGTYIITGGIPLSSYKGKAASFVDCYRAKYYEEPTFYAIYAYEVMKVALEAIKNSPTKDRETIRHSVFSIQNFNEGAMEPWSFDASGDIYPFVMSILQVQDGKFEFISEIK